MPDPRTEKVHINQLCVEKVSKIKISKKIL